jgi:hypothetical protein
MSFCALSSVYPSPGKVILCLVKCVPEARSFDDPGRPKPAKRVTFRSAMAMEILAAGQEVWHSFLEQLPTFFLFLSRNNYLLDYIKKAQKKKKKTN